MPSTPLVTNVINVEQMEAMIHLIINYKKKQERTFCIYYGLKYLEATWKTPGISQTIYGFLCVTEYKLLFFLSLYFSKHFKLCMICLYYFNQKKKQKNNKKKQKRTNLSL